MAKILLVDGMDQRRRTWQKMLTSTGHTVVSVNSVSEASRALENGEIEVMIAALWPGSPSQTTAIDLTEATRQRRADLPIVMYGFPEFGEKWKQKAREVGADEIIEKLFSIARVNTLIEKVLARAREG